MTKIVEDNFANAAPLFSEVMSLVHTFSEMREYTQSTAVTMRNNVNPAQYIVAGRQAWSKVNAPGFSRTYPTIATIIANGSTEDYSAGRLIDAIYKVGQLFAYLTANKNMLKTDAQRAEADRLLCKIVGDFCVFLITQYRLARTDDATYLSVSEFCNRNKVSPSVVYGSLMDLMKSVGEEPYGYEPMSPYFEDMQEVDPVFVSECEEKSFPLTGKMCEDLISGKLSVEEARGELIKFEQDTVVTTVEGMTTGNMIKKLNLE